jgi:hypothetical protein
MAWLSSLFFTKAHTVPCPTRHEVPWLTNKSELLSQPITVAVGVNVTVGVGVGVSVVVGVADRVGRAQAPSL